MHIIKKLDDYIAKAEGFLIVLLLSGMIALSFLQIVMRNTAQGLLWADTVLRQLVLWLGFLGASLTARDGKHIAIEILPNYLPPRAAAYVRAAANLAAAAAGFLLAYAAGIFVLMERESGSHLLPGLPAWAWQSILPFSLLLIAARCLGRAVSALPARGQEPPRNAPS